MKKKIKEIIDSKFIEKNKETLNTKKEKVENLLDKEKALDEASKKEENDKQKESQQIINDITKEKKEESKINENEKDEKNINKEPEKQYLIKRVKHQSFKYQYNL